MKGKNDIIRSRFKTKVNSPYVVDAKENKQNIYKLFKIDTYA